MLTIRDAQIDSLRAKRREMFEARLFLFLKERAAATGRLVKDRSLTEGISRGMIDAKRFKLLTERDIAQYLEIVFLEFGNYPEEGFPPMPLANLCAWGLAPEKKLERFRLWAESCNEYE